ncbi:hypothetical protein B0T21DRAFT_383267 [Apiosordaria backusii]|uniref:DUF676 domain-containing protein n=1 Tax=Apiosordaria backusii TaxID=314023 RepID=A0AA40EG87_9PEZI|nr:hypothetical protein B0T21DRAFT_383267 [Apiosordaria backusii]
MVLVLIHGLNGDPIETWRHQDTKKLWPQEFLPDARPNTRVLSYGYNGDIYLNNSAANIRDMARSILSNLDTRRDSDPQRPIIFVAHCLGGLIAKQALCFARAEPQFCNIGSATKAVDWKRIAEDYSALSPSPRSRRGAVAPLVDAITTSAPKLGKMCDDFVELTAHYLIVTWYETVVWPGTKKCIVDQTSTRMMSGADEVSLPAEAHHVNMCRFADKDDQTLQELLKHVGAALGEQIQAGEASKVQRRIPGIGMQQSFSAVTERVRVTEYERQTVLGDGSVGQVHNHQRSQMVDSGDGGSLEISRVQEVGDDSVRGIEPRAPKQIEGAPAMEAEEIPWRASEETSAGRNGSGQGTRRPNIFKRVAGRLRTKPTLVAR